MGAWVWFVIAAVAGVAGAALLLLDRGQLSLHGRERRRWAGLRGWQFADADPELTGRWRHGMLARGRAGTARDVVTGSLFTAAGRRRVHVFDYDQGGGSVVVLAAVHRRNPQQVVLELWLPSAEFPADAGLDLLGPVGDRFAFTSELATARPLITPDLVELADDVGDDVPVVWIEDDWVMASVGAAAGPSRLERLLRLLGDLADMVDGVPSEDAAARAPAEPAGARRPGGPDIRGRGTPHDPSAPGGDADGGMELDEVMNPDAGDRDTAGGATAGGATAGGSAAGGAERHDPDAAPRDHADADDHDGAGDRPPARDSGADADHAGGDEPADRPDWPRA